MSTDVELPPRLVTIGEAMVLFVNDTLGPWQVGTQMRTAAAGAELNVALGVSALGLPAQWCGVLGEDAAGDLLVRLMREREVDHPHLRRVPEPTGVLVRERRTALGSRVHYWRRGSAGSRLAVEDVATLTLDAGSFVHLTGITPALSQSASAATCSAYLRARDAGAHVSFDVNYRSRLWSPALAAEALAAYAMVDVLFATDAEARLLLGEPQSPALATPEEGLVLAEKLRRRGAAAAVVKLGHRGAVMHTQDGEELYVSAPSVPVVDTVGAGDAFVAGFLAARMQDAGAHQCLSQAVHCGAWAVTAMGDSDCSPSPADLHDLVTSDADHR